MMPLAATAAARPPMTTPFTIDLFKLVSPGAAKSLTHSGDVPQVRFDAPLAFSEFGPTGKGACSRAARLEPGATDATPLTQSLSSSSSLPPRSAVSALLDSTWPSAASTFTSNTLLSAVTTSTLK